jgi:uncharacterized protein (TIGR03435 family)
MPAFTARLSNQLGRPVVDRTGIPSRFDIRPGRRRRRRPEQRRAIHFAAIQEQLGLKLEKPAPVEIPVIEHAAKPTEN